MTVSSEIKRKDYSGDGATVSFPTEFRFLDNSHLKVILSIDATGVEAEQTLDSDYSVTGSGEDSGGTVLMVVAPATGETLTIKRNVPLTQGIDYVENDPFPASAHENGLDKLTMLVQQLQEEVDRSLKLSESQQSSGLSIPQPDSDKFLQWDEDGNLINIDISSLGSVSLTAFGQSLINSVNAAAARLVMESAALDSPVFTGTPEAPTPASGDNSARLATTAFVSESAGGATNSVWPTIAVNSADNEHDIDFSAGRIPSSDGSTVIEMDTALTKQLDSLWVAGDGVGGLFSGAIAADTAYGCFLIKKDSDGSIDCGFDIDKNAANIPVGYTAFRRIGWVVTDSSANIIKFTQRGSYFILKSQVLDINDTTPGTAANALSVTSPPGVISITSCYLDNLSSVIVLIVSTDADANAPSGDDNTLRIVGSDGAQQVETLIPVDDDRNIKYRSDKGKVVSLRIATRGWIDERL